MRIVSTPLAAPVALPPQRAGGFHAPLRDAVLPAAAPAAVAARDALGDPGVLVVTTGQQPGLFTGPLYTVYKALSAAALARELAAQWQRPVVPVFWAAGDDHDYEEARSTAWLDTAGELVVASLPPRNADAAPSSMARTPLPAEVPALLAQLGQGLPTGPFRDAALDWLGRHYRPKTTVGQAFAGAMAEFLGRFGVLVFDPTHAAARRAMGPVLARALAEAPALDRALADQASRLREAGRPTPVPVGDGATLVFLETASGRERLLPSGPRFTTRRGSHQLDQAAILRMVASGEADWSPNVLLRPVVESAILPTVAYVAGPGELAYLPMAEPLYAALGVPRQVPVPRWSGLLVEPRVDRILQKFGSSLEELLAPAQVLEVRMVRDQVPPALPRALHRWRQAMEAEHLTILGAAIEVDPTLERPAQKVYEHALTELSALEARVERHLRRRQRVELQQIGRARGSLQPVGRPQERVLGAPGWLGRYGPGLVDDVAATIGAWYADALAGAHPAS